jgi:acetoin utilization protein AcuC
MLNVLFYSHELAGFEYKVTHPFKPLRAKFFVELLNRYLLIHERNQKVIDPVPLDEELLYLFHTREYIDILKRAETGEFTVEMLNAGLGTSDNPVFRSMYQFALRAAGGTHQGAMMLLNNEARFAFNPIGGFHHAGKDHAEGFCYINDIAVTIEDLIRKGQRVVYIDIDAHHGNGVQDAFYNTDRVLTISFHETGDTLYPWSGFERETGAGAGIGYNVNVPLLTGTDDEVYVYAFESVAPSLVEAFKPDIVMAAIGCDSHKDDPLAHLNLTSNGYIKVMEIINRVSPKLLAMGAGGYNLYKTAGLWTLAWATFCGLEPEDYWAGKVGGMMYGPEIEMGTLNDPPFLLTGREKEVTFQHARKVVQYIRENVFPVHKIKV